MTNCISVFLRVILLIGICNFSGNAFAQETAEELISVQDTVKRFPKALGYVSDFEGVFTAEQINILEQKLAAYEAQTTREIAVVTVNSFDGFENIKDFSIAMGNEWGIGKKESDNGLLLLFSKKLRQIRISTGYGTEKILTDELCLKVINEIILPECKVQNYYEGIQNGLEALIEKWK